MNLRVINVKQIKIETSNQKFTSLITLIIKSHKILNNSENVIYNYINSWKTIKQLNNTLYYESEKLIRFHDFNESGYMKDIEKNFFIIDCENLAEIESNLCGFVIHEDGYIQTEVMDDLSKLTRLGSYVYVYSDDKEIRIYQDFNGSYGLYLYKTGDYFALSNSFIKLVDYIKDTKHSMSLNEDYANSFLFAELVTMSYDETLVNEIITLPRNCEVHIDKPNKQITIEEIDFEENTLELDSKKGIETLDKWFYKWVGILRHVKSISNNISVDLTGGFDSRVIAAIWLNANINLDEIRINSYNDDKHCHPEDFRIASEIGNKFGFKLNQKHFDNEKVSYDDVYTPMLNSFYPKLCFHTEMNFKPFRYRNRIYHFTGSSGECLRGYPNETPEEFFNILKNYIADFDTSLISSAKRLFSRSLDKISKKYNIADKNSLKMQERHYKETRSRLHSGKMVVEYFLINDYYINPFFDEDIYKLKLTADDCDDPYLLFALIFARYCPELLEFEYEGGRIINPETIDYAKKITSKYPLNKPEYEKISFKDMNPPLENNNTATNPLKIDDIDNYLKKIFYSKSYEMEFKKYFSDRSYGRAHDLVEYSNYYPLRAVYTSIGILKVIDAIHYNESINADDYEKQWFSNFLTESYKDNKLNLEKNLKLVKYSTARIDIKNFGTENKIEIISNSDNIASVTRPSWFKNDEGEGVLIQSNKGYIDLEFKCINNGTLKIWFRGVDFISKNKQRFPIYINYICSTINNDEIFNNRLTCHDEPAYFEKKVNDSEIVKLHVEWEPMSDSAIYNNKLKSENNDLKNELDRLREENDKLKRKNESLLNITSNNY